MKGIFEILFILAIILFLLLASCVDNNKECIEVVSKEYPGYAIEDSNDSPCKFLLVKEDPIFTTAMIVEVNGDDVEIIIKNKYTTIQKGR